MVQYAVYRVRYAVYRVQYAVYRVQYAVYRVQYAVYREWCDYAVYTFYMVKVWILTLSYYS